MLPIVWYKLEDKTNLIKKKIITEEKVEL
jgi:hypothetical protein